MTLLLADGIGAPPGGGVSGARDINVAPESDIAQQNLSSGSYRAGQRFVLDDDETISRWWFTYITDGSVPNPAPSHTGYGSGDEGTLHCQIRAVDQSTGLPIATVIAEESGIAVASRRAALRTTYGSLPVNHQSMYFEFSPVTLTGGTMYASIIRNTHANPGNGSGGDGPPDPNGNHGSIDCAIPLLTVAGPHGINNTDPDAAGALYGLDPRECTFWSNTSESTWLFGGGVGTGHYTYPTRAWIWHGHGFRRSPSNEDVGHGPPGAAWMAPAACTVKWLGSPVAIDLTEAGGCTRSTNLGVVTVTNNTTGQSRQTASLGTGVVRGNLKLSGSDNPLHINIGDDYTISSAGTVERLDTFTWQQIYGIGSRTPFKYVSTGCPSNKDLPSLFALPHPHYS